MTGLNIARLDSSAKGFEQELQKLLAWSEQADAGLDEDVRRIIAAIRTRGDQALLEYTNKWDRRQAASVDELRISKDQMQVALAGLDAKQRWALEQAAERISAFHQRQLQQSWSYRDEMGNLLGQQVTPLARVGVYVPGGKAAYPSSVLMNVLPAKVAGVEEIVMVSPSPGGEHNNLVLAAAALAGVTSCLSIGGAQAVAALAYGTESIAPVDKIVGPGNAFVAAAKRMVFGRVGIDMVAGPSEILVVADDSVPAHWVAMDMLSQAEHDEQAQAVLISTDANYLEAVEKELAKALDQLERRDIAKASLESRGALIRVADLGEAVALINRIAPEHLELAVRDAEALSREVRHAGAIFLGAYSPEAVGDYCAGPNHVLPTSATARFSSPLGVYDFQKRSSVIGCSPQGGRALGEIAAVLARGESLTAHARSAELRMAEIANRKSAKENGKKVAR